MEPEDTLSDRYCFDCTGKTVPKVCLISIDSGDSEDFLSRFHTAFARYSCKLSHLAFFRRPRSGAIPLTDLERCEAGTGASISRKTTA
jgi:dipeptidase E